MWSKAILGATAAIFVAGWGSQGLAAQAVGKAAGVTPSAAAGGNSGIRALQVEDPLFMGDVVTTGSTGQLQLAFVDNTRMVIGPGSRLTIDSFIFQGHAMAGQFSVNAVRGAFRFITGSSAKQAYAIKTPTATIGVRGTRFDLSVGANGSTNLALYDGSVRLCDRARPQKCTIVSGACSIAVLGPDHDFRSVKDVAERKAYLNKVFPYAFRQAGLGASFQVNSSGCKVAFTIEAPRFGSSNPVGGGQPASNPVGVPASPSAPPTPPPPPPSGRTPPGHHNQPHNRGG